MDQLKQNREMMREYLGYKAHGERLTPLLIRFDKPKRKSKKGTQKHETPGQDKPQTEGIVLPEIA